MFLTEVFVQTLKMANCTRILKTHLKQFRFKVINIPCNGLIIRIYSDKLQVSNNNLLTLMSLQKFTLVYKVLATRMKRTVLKVSLQGYVTFITKKPTSHYVLSESV